MSDGPPTVAGYAIVLGVAFLARSALSLLEVSYVTPGQRSMWSWLVFAVFSVAFAAATFLANRARLATPAETLRSSRARILAVAIGATVACLTAWTDWLLPAASARGLASIHVPGFTALPFYVYGAILITVLFHFLPVAAAAWLAEQLPATAGRLVVIAAVTAVAFSEDASYFLRSPQPLDIESARHALSVAANASEAILIYRYGLLAGLLQRGTTYLLWHIVWPNMGLV